MKKKTNTDAVSRQEGGHRSDGEGMPGFLWQGGVSPRLLHWHFLIGEQRTGGTQPKRVFPWMFQQSNHCLVLLTAAAAVDTAGFATRTEPGRLCQAQTHE